MRIEFRDAVVGGKGKNILNNEMNKRDIMYDNHVHTVFFQVYHDGKAKSVRF